jgi:hypothetical protein
VLLGYYQGPHYQAGQQLEHRIGSMLSPPQSVSAASRVQPPANTDSRASSLNRPVCDIPAAPLLGEVEVFQVAGRVRGPSGGMEGPGARTQPADRPVRRQSVHRRPFAPLVLDCSSRSRPPARGRLRPCAPSPSLGPKTAVSGPTPTSAHRIRRAWACGGFCLPRYRKHGSGRRGPTLKRRLPNLFPSWCEVRGSLAGQHQAGFAGDATAGDIEGGAVVN